MQPNGPTPAKKSIPEVDIMLDGKPHTLKYPYSALAKFTDFLGIPANDLQKRLDGKHMMLSDLPVLLWAGLQKKHKTPYHEVEDLVDEMKPAELKDVFEKAQKAMSEAFPSDERMMTDKEDADSAGNAQEMETTQT